MSLTDGYLEPLGRCERCGQLVLESYLIEFDGELLCPNDLETALAEYELID